MAEIYQQLAAFLDDLPAGYPRTEGGVELRILEKLFTPEEAQLFTHLSLLGESARVVAYRAHQRTADVRQMLAVMEKKGLVAAEGRPGKNVKYAVNQFVVGFMEEQVDHLDRELAELLEEYLPSFFQQGPWKQVPQIRTVPVGVSIPVHYEVMAYERADEIVRRHTEIAVRNCVCRQQRQLIDKGCGKPLETCLSFGSGARQTAESGRGRLISQEEALAILQVADQAGLVLQPANSKDPIFICACCGCCCGVLRGIKYHEKPADLVANAFVAHFEAELCSTCGTCVDRCQMEALSLSDIAVNLNPDRCIGCGLCVSTCPSGALTLERKPDAKRASIPGNTLSTYLRLGQARGKLSGGKLVEMVVKSTVDRLIAPK